MDRLWSPWRSEYVTGTSSPEDDGCVFCDHLAAGDDRETHILWRGKHVFVLLNAYPYNSGHVMIAPLRHVGDLNEMSHQERAELMDATNRSVGIITEAMNPGGFNVGMNLGPAGGAGIPGHLHMHVVPRWGGDTNFMTTIGETKVLPTMLADTDAKLRPLFEVG
ncbi:MAG: HIT domain-containing protein [Actinobacteria bacterium]|jgi:ATP adenylyltransferase|nr:HIT domain-containing protein [Actinomycetota bacterium]